VKLTPEKLLPYGIAAAGVVVLGLIVWIWVKGAKGAATQAARGLTGAAGGLVSGAVLGVGDTFGVPDPGAPENQVRCEQALAAGNGSDVYWYCPASTAVKYFLRRRGQPAALNPPTQDALIKPVVTTGGDAATSALELGIP
jgi:hypothetical protein